MANIDTSTPILDILSQDVTKTEPTSHKEVTNGVVTVTIEESSISLLGKKGALAHEPKVNLMGKGHKDGYVIGLR